MIAKLSPDLVRELEQAGGQPLPLENPQTKRLYVLVDAEQYDVVRREQTSSSGNWSAHKNERRCALIRKKFSEGIEAEEARELAELQEELSAFRKNTAPLPYDILATLQAAVDSEDSASPPPA